MGVIANTQEFIEGVQAEMKKVTWPDRDQLRNATAVILVFVIILAIIIGLMDQVFSALVRGIVGLFGG
jgi:preprotein translocase subunit SecE